MNKPAVVLTVVNCVLLAFILRQDRAVNAAEDVHAVVRGNAFELVDAAGHIRSTLTIEESGEAVFRLRSQGGEIRVKLGATNDGSGLLLIDGATEPAVHLLAQTDSSLIRIRAAGEENVITP